MVSRHREQDVRSQLIGTRVSPIGPTTTYVSKTDGVWRVCDDHTGGYPVAQDFNQYESTSYIPFRTCSGPNGYTWTSCPLAYQPALPDPRQKWPVLTLLDRNNLAWKILSESNPSVPHVSVPTALAELKDLPSLVKAVRGRGFGFLDSIAKAMGKKAPRSTGGILDSFGNQGRLEAAATAAKQLANAHLSWRWAIRPMINDLRKLLDFQKSVNQRLQWLYKLRAGETLRKRVGLGTTKISDAQQNIFIDTTGCWIVGTSQLHYAMKAWGSAQWKLSPDSVLPQLGAAELNKLARNLTYGITSYETLAAAWELTPWSWLVDWFANVGDVISASNNTLDCTWSNVCYMRTCVAVREVKFNKTSSDGYQLSALAGQDYFYRTVRKERYVVFPVLPVPVPQLPCITAGQWSILAALAVQRL